MKKLIILCLLLASCKKKEVVKYHVLTVTAYSKTGNFYVKYQDSNGNMQDQHVIGHTFTTTINRNVKWTQIFTCLHTPLNDSCSILLESEGKSDFVKGKGVNLNLCTTVNF